MQLSSINQYSSGHLACQLPRLSSLAWLKNMEQKSNFEVCTYTDLISVYQVFVLPFLRAFHEKDTFLSCFP